MAERLGGAAALQPGPALKAWQAARDQQLARERRREQEARRRAELQQQAALAAQRGSSPRRGRRSRCAMRARTAKRRCGGCTGRCCAAGSRRPSCARRRWPSKRGRARRPWTNWTPRSMARVNRNGTSGCRRWKGRPKPCGNGWRPAGRSGRARGSRSSGWRRAGTTRRSCSG
ncbi:hypothetical protein LJK88_33660 [Paenibacillus sp. P26]|nr:hypothetical protein LJK88_33660 [Paenibacillus sp. P26]